MISKKELGQLVKKARKLKSETQGVNYTQKKLAEDIGKSQSYIGDIESGRSYPSFALLGDIANACQVPLGYFHEEDSLDQQIEDFIRHQLDGTPDSEVTKIKEQIMSDKSLKVHHIPPKVFKNMDEALDFFFSLKVVRDYFEFDIFKLRKEEFQELKNDMLQQFKLLSYKYKK